MHQQLPDLYRDAEVRCVLPHCPGLTESGMKLIGVPST